ncbi:MAG: HAMP domain-containing sensor histidine kinase [Bacteroidia bacterium]|nr:HAMP domain-containing sensor histidine kinase [Bacteroidia bacterium]
MKSKLPSSILVSLYLSIGLTIFYVFIRSAASDWNFADSFGEILLFLFVTFLSLVMTLEWLVYRRLKSLQLVNQREIKKLKDLETYRREFLGEVSHELKTPIFAVQGFIHTLMDGAIDDEKVKMKFLKKAMRNADRLSSLVEDLLIITQAESGEMEMRIRKFRIYELIIDVIESLEYKFTKKNRNISFRLVSNGHEDTYVLADRERILQVLTNLVDNAIKYGDSEGEIQVALTSEENKMYVSVADEGKGIDQEHLDKIFRRFYRVDKSRSRDKGGTGLGLAICKHLLKLHGEQITVESSPGTGTVFSFSLKMTSDH